MFAMRRRRRPVMRAAVVGGAGYMAGKRGAENRQADAQQQAPAPPPAAPAPPAPPAEPDTIAQLKQLADLHSAGALSDEEFAATKAKVLG